jgi:hypothetical protein
MTILRLVDEEMERLRTELGTLHDDVDHQEEAWGTDDSLTLVPSVADLFD